MSHWLRRLRMDLTLVGTVLAIFAALAVYGGAQQMSKRNRQEHADTRHMVRDQISSVNDRITSEIGGVNDRIDNTNQQIGALGEQVAAGFSELSSRLVDLRPPETLPEAASRLERSERDLEQDLERVANNPLMPEPSRTLARDTLAGLRRKAPKKTAARPDPDVGLHR